MHRIAHLVGPVEAAPDGTSMHGGTIELTSHDRPDRHTGHQLGGSPPT